MASVPALPVGDVVVPDAQRKTSVWKHPDRDAIEAYMRRGRTPGWVAGWLSERYPDRPENRRFRIGERALTRYRRRFIPEASPGVDLVRSEIEDMIGRRPPLPLGRPVELEVMETAADAMQFVAAKGLKSDGDLPQQQTMDAIEKWHGMLGKTVELKGKLGLPGYEIAAVRQVIDQTIDQRSHNVNVDLYGREPREPGTGAGEPNQPEAVRALIAIAALPPDEQRQVIRAARADVDSDAEVIDAE